MPRIDPKTLIQCLHSLLNSEGGILGSSEVKRLVTLMSKYSNTLVSKVCYVLILKATDEELLVEFMADGGWELVFQWLGTAITNCNNPFIKELLQLLIKCPIRLDRLKESNAPRTVKGLSKDSEDSGVRDLARQLVEMWLEFIKSGRAAVEPIVAAPVEPTPVYTAPPSSPPQTPKPKSSPVQPFKIIVRDGKRVLMSVGSDDSPPPKVKKVEKQIEHITSNKVKDEIQKKSNESSSSLKVNSDINAMKAAISQNISKTDQEEIKKTEISSKEKKDKKDHKEHSRSSSSSSSHKSHKSSSHDKVKEHSRDKSKDSSRDKNKDSLKKKDTKEKSKDSKPKISEKDSHRKSSIDKDANFDDDPPPKSAMPPISSLGKIPKKTSSSNVISAAEASASGGVLGAGKSASPLPVAKKGTYSDERKRSSELKPSERPKTVKTLPTKFRSTGLEEEVKPPPSRSDIKKKEHTKDQPKRPSSSSKEEKDGGVPSEKKSKIDVTDIKEKIDKLSEKSGGIKLIAPKAKPVIVESDMFIDALKASATKDQKKKKRRSSSSGSTSNSTKETEIKKESGELSPKITKSSSSPKETSPLRENKPLKFYRDTLDDQDTEVPETKPVIQPKDIKEENVPVSPKPKLFPEGVLVVHRSSSAPKKSVRWRTESDLVRVQYFELDETERVNVSRTNFVDLKAMERNRERETFLMHKMGSEDTGTSKMSWGPLFLVDVPAEKQPPEQGLNSTEKAVQHARQKTVLEVLYFNRAMIPDSPAEPDHESHPMTDPKPIPLEDSSGSKDTTYDYSSTPWPEPKPDMNAELNMSLPPPNVPAVAPFNATGYASYPTYPVGAPTGAPGPDSWRPSEEGGDAANLNFSNTAVPPIYGMTPAGMAPPYGPPPPNMIPPENYNMGMYPPNPGFPMGPPNPGMFGPGPPMGPMGPPPPGWGGNPWNGPGGPPMLPLDTRNICRTWRKTGNCIRGSNCRFLHPGVNCPPLPPP